MNVTDFIAHFFSDERINHVFGVSGANIEDLMSELARINQTKVILAKSEYNAATMALGSYLASKEVGVVLTTSGPGILNTLPVLAEAFASKIPFVLISGIVPEGLEGMGAFQDTSGKGESFNILDMLAPCTSFLFKAHNEQEIPEALYKAFQICRIQKKPAVLLIPKNLFNKEINKEVLKSLIFDEVKFPDTTNAALFCEEFSSADKRPPLVVLGEELIHVKDLTPVLDFIDKSAGMVALTPNAKGLFDHRHPQFLGLTGVMGHDEVNNYLKKTEHVVFIGTGFDLLSRFGMESDLSQKHLLLVKEEKGYGLYNVQGKTVCEVYGDIESIMSSLSDSFIAPLKAANGEEKPKTNTTGFSLKNIIEEIEDSLEADSNIFIDAGNSGAFVIHHLKHRGSGACYVSLGMGGMGNSVGAGIGGAVASQKKSYIFLGDGSFLIHGWELHTANEYDLPVVFFILNNNSHGMCTTRENVFLGGKTGINDFKKSFYASGLEKIFPGLIAHEVFDFESLRRALGEIKDINSPCVVSINISNDEDPPFRTFYKT